MPATPGWLFLLISVVIHLSAIWLLPFPAASVHPPKQEILISLVQPPPKTLKPDLEPDADVPPRPLPSPEHEQLRESQPQAKAQKAAARSGRLEPFRALQQPPAELPETAEAIGDLRASDSSEGRAAVPGRHFQNRGQRRPPSQNNDASPTGTPPGQRDNDPAARPTGTPLPQPPLPEPEAPEVDVEALLQMYAAHVKARILGEKYYPAVAERLGHTGAVKVSFTVAAGGGLASARVKYSSGYDDLDNAALDAVQRAAPFDQIPLEIARDSLSLSITLRYTLD